MLGSATAARRQSQVWLWFVSTLTSCVPPACWQQESIQQELARHGCVRLFSDVLGTWGMGHQDILAKETRHPCTKELPRYSRVILKPEMQYAVDFAWASRVLNGKGEGPYTSMPGETMEALFHGKRTSGPVLARGRALVLLGSCCWLSGRSWS